MHTKQLYEAPEAELLVVRFEENLCQSRNGVRSNSASSDYDPDYELGEI